MLIVLQAMDAAGKDGTIKHVMSGVNPQGCQVFSFKKPSTEELDHNFLWRYMKALPERGRIGIFNRSYYEDVLVVRVHPQILDARKLPTGNAGEGSGRSGTTTSTASSGISYRNGTLVLKFFLHVSKERAEAAASSSGSTTRRRTGSSRRRTSPNATIGTNTGRLRGMLRHTSTEWAPWYVIPADHKWVTRALVSGVIAQRIKELGLKRPAITREQQQALAGEETVDGQRQQNARKKVTPIDARVRS